MNKTKKDNYKNFSSLLLNWYDKNRRSLPWRALPEQLPNPYFVYLSEIMLQQTVVSTVIPYFSKFSKKWNTIEQLARADFEEISSYWAGLGYYRRAKNLHETAKIITNDYRYTTVQLEYKQHFRIASRSLCLIPIFIVKFVPAITTISTV